MKSSNIITSMLISCVLLLRRCALALLPLMLPLQAVIAQGGLPAEQRINGKLVWSAFEQQREVLQMSSAVIYTDEKARIKSLYGVVVHEDGYILTKASEIEGVSDLSLRIGSQLYTEVDQLAVNDDWDVALLKIKSSEPLSPVVLADGDIEQGCWVVSNGSTTRSNRRLRVGVVSAATRPITATKSRVVMGVEFEKEEEKKWKVANVSEGKGAEKAGLKAGDVIVAVDGVKLVERKDLLDVLQSKQPGDEVSVEFIRGSKQMRIDINLSERVSRMTRNDQMSGGEDQLSARRSEFPRVIHHDTPLTKVSVGGPLLNLDGACVGMNIARASRVATFAIPARELRDLISGMIE
ncbi:MAG: PDZ domain-containing protein [Akkermansiaceae bacterium]